MHVFINKYFLKIQKGLGKLFQVKFRLKSHETSVCCLFRGVEFWTTRGIYVPAPSRLPSGTERVETGLGGLQTFTEMQTQARTP